MVLLADSDIKLSLESMDGWVFVDNTIQKEILFDSYMASINFINQLAEIAEKNNHHPDLLVGWCRINITFTSHDQGGVTLDCIQMANAIESFQNLQTK